MSYIQYIKKHDRFENYEFNESLYEGDHYEVFNMKQFEYYSDPKNQYIAYNYAEILTNAFNNLIWSEPPQITFKNADNQDFFEEYFSHDGFLLKMRQATETSSYAGEAIFQLAVDELEPNKYGVITCIVDNCKWYPIFDENNPSKPAKGHIIYTEKKIDEKSEDVACLLEIHTSGKIEWESYVIKKDVKEPQQVNPKLYFEDILANVGLDITTANSLTPSYSTNCRYPLVFHLPNVKRAGEFFGISDYTVPVIAKIYAINQNYNQIQYVLRKHAHPKMIVPKETIKQAINQVTTNNQQAQNMGYDDSEKASKLFAGNKTLFETIIAQKIIDKVEFFGSDVNSTDPKYLTWDGNLNESREQITILKQALFEETQLAKVLIDPELGVGNASGVAILRLAQPSLHKAVMKQAYIADTMGKLIYSILDLAKNTPSINADGLDPEIPTIKFRDGLVNDLAETIANQEALLNNQLTTQIDAIMATQDLNLNNATIKANEIKNENQLFQADNQIITAKK